MFVFNMQFGTSRFPSHPTLLPLILHMSYSFGSSNTMVLLAINSGDIITKENEERIDKTDCILVWTLLFIGM
jgi:hypothetical protein